MKMWQAEDEEILIKEPPAPLAENGRFLKITPSMEHDVLQDVGGSEVLVESVGGDAHLSALVNADGGPGVIAIGFGMERHIRRLRLEGRAARADHDLPRFAL